jgi:uncharacterized protein (TIGR02646 family)
MILIKKGQEPEEWRSYRLTPGVEFSPIPELRDSLYKEQGYICAYCMRRIPARDILNRGRNGSLERTNEDHRIEHILCQDLHPDEQLNYKNLVICCPGHINGQDHCDRAKGNRDLSFSPMDKNFINTISYKTDGTIVSSDSDCNREMNEILNLNDEMLKSNRVSTWSGVLKQIQHSEFSKRLVRKMLNYYQDMHNNRIGDSEVMTYEPYCGIILYHLQKMLNKRS